MAPYVPNAPTQILIALRPRNFVCACCPKRAEVLSTKAKVKSPEFIAGTNSQYHPHRHSSPLAFNQLSVSLCMGGRVLRKAELGCF